MTETPQIARRKFSGLLTLGGIAAAIAALWAVRKHFRAQAGASLQIARTSSLAPGASLVFSYPTPEAPCLLIRAPSGNYVAYSRICTHAGCPVFFHPENNDIECPCHGGVFALDDGRVLAGPPPRPLPQIRLDVRGDQIFATGVLSS